MNTSILLQTAKRKAYQHKYLFLICAILLIAIFFRFYNYPNRWGLGSDQARDAIIVRFALKTHRFPLIGPFSASGPFVFGSTWYLIFMLLTSQYPSFILTPWVMQSILFVGIVLLMIMTGEIIGGKPLALIVGIFTAVSPAQIDSSTNLIFSSFENVISAGALFFFAYVCKKRTMIWYFLLGLSIGLAITIHFQAIPLLVLFPITIFLTKTNPKKILIMLLGFCIPFIPLLLFDLQSNFFESKNFISYFFSANKTPQQGVRWLTYALVFWPGIWANNIGGFTLFGYIDIAGLIAVVIYTVKKKLLNRTILGCLISFFIIFILLRYFGGQLFPGFLSFLYPFILLFVGWMCARVFVFNKYIGSIFLISLITGSTIFSFTMITHATNNTAAEAQTYPRQKYAIYDYHHQSTSLSLPLVLFIYSKHENKATGTPFGLATQQLKNVHIVDHITDTYEIYVYNLTSIGKTELLKDWVLVNPAAIYSSVENWYEK